MFKGHNYFSIGPESEIAQIDNIGDTTEVELERRFSSCQHQTLGLLQLLPKLCSHREDTGNEGDSPGRVQQVEGYTLDKRAVGYYVCTFWFNFVLSDTFLLVDQ